TSITRLCTPISPKKNSIRYSRHSQSECSPPPARRGLARSEDEVPMEKVLTRYIGTPNLWKLETYRSLGGYQTLEKALREYQPDDIVTMVLTQGFFERLI